MGRFYVVYLLAYLYGRYTIRRRRVVDFLAWYVRGGVWTR